MVSSTPWRSLSRVRKRSRSLARCAGVQPFSCSQQVEHRIHHGEREFAGDGKRRAAQKQIVEMFDGLVADQKLHFTHRVAGVAARARQGLR